MQYESRRLAGIDFVVPATRNTDPRTSFDAERSHTESGNRTGNLANMVAWVKMNPGHVATEIAEKTKTDRHETSRRLADARTLGLLRNGDSRKPAGGNKQMTWYEK